MGEKGAKSQDGCLRNIFCPSPLAIHADKAALLACLEDTLVVSASSICSEKSPQPMNNWIDAIC